MFPRLGATEGTFVESTFRLTFLLHQEQLRSKPSHASNMGTSHGAGLQRPHNHKSSNRCEMAQLQRPCSASCTQIPFFC